MTATVVTELVIGDATYRIERFDDEPPRNRWRLVYPDGGHQRTGTKANAVRLANLHADDFPAWSIEVTGR